MSARAAYGTLDRIHYIGHTRWEDMTALLDILQEAWELAAAAEREKMTALKRAAEQHTLRELASVTGLTRQGVHYLLRREREENGK